MFFGVFYFSLLRAHWALLLAYGDRVMAHRILSTSAERTNSGYADGHNSYIQLLLVPFEELSV